MGAASNFLGINTGTDTARAAITKPGGIAYVLAYITVTGRLWFFDGVIGGGIQLALSSDLGTQLASIYPAKTANFNAVAGKRYHIDSVGGAITATLPASPGQGDTIAFVDTTGQAASHAVTIALNGKNYLGATANPILNIAYATLKIEFNGTQWIDSP